MNAGAAYTNNLTVSLALTATDALSGVAQMRFIDNGNWTWSAWEPYTTTKTYTLHGTSSGTRNLYVQFSDNAGGMSYAYGIIDTIYYDPIAPTGTMTVNGGATYTATPAVTLNSAITDTGGSTLYQMSIDPGSGTFGSPVAYAASYPFTLATGEGLKTVRVTYTDKAGNALTRSYSITLGPNDSTPPTGSIVVNAGATYTNTTAAALTLSAVDTGGAGIGPDAFQQRQRDLEHVGDVRDIEGVDSHRWYRRQDGLRAVPRRREQHQRDVLGRHCARCHGAYGIDRYCRGSCKHDEYGGLVDTVGD